MYLSIIAAGWDVVARSEERRLGLQSSTILCSLREFLRELETLCRVVCIPVRCDAMAFVILRPPIVMLTLTRSCKCISLHWHQRLELTDEAPIA